MALGDNPSGNTPAGSPVGWFQGLTGGNVNENNKTPGIDTTGVNSQLDQSAAARAQQQKALSDAQAMAEGKGPSAATALLNENAANAMADQNAMASSGSGNESAGLNRRTAMMNNSRTMQGLGGQAATARAGEQLGGIAMEGQEAGAMRGGDLSGAGLEGQLATNQAQLQQQTNQLNTQAQAQNQQQNNNALSSLGGMVDGVAGLFGDMPVGETHLKEPGGSQAPGGGSHWILREEPDFILAKNMRTGKVRKLLMAPLDEEEEARAMASHGAGPLPQQGQPVHTGQQVDPRATQPQVQMPKREQVRQQHSNLYKQTMGDANMGGDYRGERGDGYAVYGAAMADTTGRPGADYRQATYGDADMGGDSSDKPTDYMKDSGVSGLGGGSSSSGGLQPLAGSSGGSGGSMDSMIGMATKLAPMLAMADEDLTPTVGGPSGLKVPPGGDKGSDKIYGGFKAKAYKDPASGAGSMEDEFYRAGGDEPDSDYVEKLRQSGGNVSAYPVPGYQGQNPSTATGVPPDEDVSLAAFDRLRFGEGLDRTAPPQAQGHPQATGGYDKGWDDAIKAPEAGPEKPSALQRALSGYQKGKEAFSSKQDYTPMIGGNTSSLVSVHADEDLGSFGGFQAPTSNFERPRATTPGTVQENDFSYTPFLDKVRAAQLPDASVETGWSRPDVSNMYSKLPQGPSLGPKSAMQYGYERPQMTPEVRVEGKSSGPDRMAPDEGERRTRAGNKEDKGFERKAKAVTADMNLKGKKVMSEKFGSRRKVRR